MVNVIISCIYGIVLGITLSIDAFMFSLLFGATIKYRRERIFTSIIVGAFHFLFALCGYYLTNLLFTHTNLYRYIENRLEYLAFIILVFLGIMMINKKDSDVKYDISFFFHKCLFAFSVSVDSFFTGIALKAMDHIIILITAPLFAFISCILTYVSLKLSKSTSNRFIDINMNIYAGILLIILAIISLFI